MLEIREMKSTGPDISFEMPAHEMCVERRAVLYRADGKSEYMTFGIDFMPDKIHVNGRMFVYEGVSDGRGFYREWEMLPKQPEIYDTHGSLGFLPPTQEQTIAYLESEIGRLRGELSRQKASFGVEEVLQVLGNSGIDTDCAACMSVAFTGYNDTEHTCGRAVTVGVEFLGAKDRQQDPGQAPSSHTTASPCNDMPCSRCSEVLETVRQMAENPPGLPGVLVNKERFGNKYIDWGWIEACNRVIRLLVPDDSGTSGNI